MAFDPPLEAAVITDPLPEVRGLCPRADFPGYHGQNLPVFSD
jgi:hypothetical protein